MKSPKSIRSLFSLPGFVAASALGGVFGDRYARVIVLQRRKKPPSALSAVAAATVATTNGPVGHAMSRRLVGASISSSSAGASIARGAAACS